MQELLKIQSIFSNLPEDIALASKCHSIDPSGFINRSLRIRAICVQTEERFEHQVKAAFCESGFIPRNEPGT
jgi:hypothetical protein